MPYEDKYTDFEQYLASGEPGVEECTRNWLMAIGLQDAHRLKPSEFLLEQAKANIEVRFRARRSASDLRSIIVRNRFERKRKPTEPLRQTEWQTESIFF